MPTARPGPVERRLVVGHPVDDEVDEVLVGAQDVAVDRPGAVVADGLAVARQLGRDVVHDHRVLLALVLGVGEDERQQLLGAELLERPVEGVHAAAPARHVGPGVGVVAAGRGVDGHAGERLGGQAEALVARRGRRR